MIFRFEWEQIVLPELIKKLKNLSGREIANDEEVIQLTVSILKSSGGLPLANSSWNAEHRFEVAKKLLNESIRNLLKKRYNYRNTHLGILVDNENLPKTHSIISINQASRSTLERLPVIGTKLAERIINSRRSDGAFKSIQDVANRVSGIGQEGIMQLKAVFSFRDDFNSNRPHLSSSFEDNLQNGINLVKLNGKSNSLLDFLEEVAVFSSSNPHPSSLAGIKRDDLEPSIIDQEVETTFISNEVELLTDKMYIQKLPDLIKSANESVSVCMFFISLGNENHPNRNLLKILIERARQGVNVKVLVDKDRDEDPYGSRIVNRPAINYLLENGVDVKSDTPEKLLHSKFIVIDSKKVVLGSHNWTSGSYFNYHDISLVLNGEQVGNYWKNRFQYLWDFGRLPD